MGTKRREGSGRERLRWRVSFFSSQGTQHPMSANQSEQRCLNLYAEGDGRAHQRPCGVRITVVLFQGLLGERR